MFKYQPKKVVEIPPIEFNRSVQGQYKTSVINEDGTVDHENGWHKNLILDCGLDKVAYMPWAQVFQFCVAGDQPSGLVTPANTGDTQLERPLMMNSYYLPGSGNCGDEVYQSGDYRYLRLFRTFDFLHVKQNTIITELGFKETPGAQKLFSRVVLDGNTGEGRPNPDVLRPGQFLRVKYELNVQLDPVYPSASGGQPTGADGALPTISWSGSSQSTDRHGLQHIGMLGINESGVAYPVDNGGACNEPFAVGAVDFGPSFGYINRWQNGLGVMNEINSGYEYPHPNSGTLVHPSLPSGIIVGYKQPQGSERLADRPGPLLDLAPHQDINRFLNHDAITGSGFIGTSFVNSHKNMSGKAGNVSNVTNLVSGASGYWPWGNYLRYQQLADFATAYGISIENETSQSYQHYGNSRMYVIASASQYYYNSFRTPFFGYGPLNFVMTPVSKYGTQFLYNNWGIFSPYNSPGYATAGNTNNSTSSSSYSHLHNLFSEEIAEHHGYNDGSVWGSEINHYTQYFNVTDFFDPAENSSVGSYLNFDEKVVVRGYSTAGRSVPWDSWDLRGASCFLTTHTGLVAPFGQTGVSFDRSAGEDFYELPLRKDPYNQYQTGDTRELYKFCFFDNAVANSVENSVRIHEPWKMVGVGATTDWSINPLTMSGAARDNGYVYRLYTPRDKDNDHILKVSFKYTWTRNTGQL